MAVRPVPEGHEAITPYLHVRGAAEAIAFYVKVFGARELYRMAEPGGRIGHAELRFGGGMLMLADEHPEVGALSPESVGGSPLLLVVYVEDVDATVKRALEAGARLARPVEDQFYGDRAGSVTDPFGHVWWIATNREDVPPVELERRAALERQK